MVGVTSGVWKAPEASKAVTFSRKGDVPERITLPFIFHAALTIQCGRLHSHIARANGPALNHWDAVDMTKLVASLARFPRP